MKTRLWNVTINGRMPAFRQFTTFDEAVSFVSAETGEAESVVRSDNAAGCPTMHGNGNEYDIEKDHEARP